MKRVGMKSGFEDGLVDGTGELVLVEQWLSGWDCDLAPLYMRPNGVIDDCGRRYGGGRGSEPAVVV